MSDEQPKPIDEVVAAKPESKPAAKSGAKSARPSEAEIKKALGASAEFASIDGASVVIVYPSLAIYNERTSADVEALRKLAPIASSEVGSFDPAKERLINPNTPISSAHLPSPDGAQRLVVVYL